MAYWKRIQGFPDYRIDTNGNVYGKRFGKPLKQYLTGESDNNYKTVKLYKNGVGYNIKVHKLLLKTFVGKCPEKMETCHINGDRLDNKLSNLCWGTSSDNRKDSIKHGTANCIRKGKGSPHYGHYKLRKPNILE